MNISVSRDGVEIGEWTEEQVSSFYKEGQLLPTDHYWKEGMSEWLPLRNFIKPALPPHKKQLPQVAVKSNAVLMLGGLARLPYVGAYLALLLVAFCVGVLAPKPLVEPILWCLYIPLYAYPVDTPKKIFARFCQRPDERQISDFLSKNGPRGVNGISITAIFNYLAKIY